MAEIQSNQNAMYQRMLQLATGSKVPSSENALKNHKGAPKASQKKETANSPMELLMQQYAESQGLDSNKTNGVKQADSKTKGDTEADKKKAKEKKVAKKKADQAQEEKLQAEKLEAKRAASSKAAQDRRKKRIEEAKIKTFSLGAPPESDAEKEQAELKKLKQVA